MHTVSSLKSSLINIQYKHTSSSAEIEEAPHVSTAAVAVTRTAIVSAGKTTTNYNINSSL